MQRSPDGKKRVYLVEDHPLVRESLANLINRQTDMSVIGESASIAAALQDITAQQPDLAIVDLCLDDGSGLDLIKAIRGKLPSMAVIVLSMHDEEYYAERCIRAGARGYVMKRESGTRIVVAIREVLAGKMSVSDKIAAAFAQKFVSGRTFGMPSPIEALSDRELEVFGLLGKGMTTRQVAEIMRISVKTVRAFCSRIKQKLQLSTASELLREAIHWQDRNNQKSSGEPRVSL